MPNEQIAITQEQLDKLDQLLKSVNLDKVTSESAGSSELQDGYYMCKVDAAKLTVSKAGNLQVAVTLSVVEDFFYKEENENDEPTLVKTDKSYKNRKIFKYYPLTDDKSVSRFASDMLKFEEAPGKPLLPKEAFTEHDTMQEAIGLIVSMQIYVNASNTLDKDGKVTNTWYNLISWKRASMLGLPVDD